MFFLSGELSFSAGAQLRVGLIPAALASLPSPPAAPYPVHGMAFAFRVDPDTGQETPGWYPKAKARARMPWVRNDLGARVW